MQVVTAIEVMPGNVTKAINTLNHLWMFMHYTLIGQHQTHRRGYGLDKGNGMLAGQTHG